MNTSEIRQLARLLSEFADRADQAGCSDEVAITVPALPAEVDRRHVGETIGDIKLIDIARTGSHFRIVSVRRDESHKGTEITFEVLFRDELDRAFPRVDCYYMLDHAPEAQGKAPSFLIRYAVPNTDI